MSGEDVGLVITAVVWIVSAVTVLYAIRFFWGVRGWLADIESEMRRAADTLERLEVIMKKTNGAKS